MSSGISKGIIDKVEVSLRWDPSPSGEPDNDLDIVAGTYTSEDPHGDPDYLVHFDSRSPDGTITLNRDSRTGQGFGADEVMTLELDRLAESYARVVIAVAVQQREGRKTFAEVPSTDVRVQEGITELTRNDFAAAADATAAVVAEFVRGEAGQWEFREAFRGLPHDPDTFAELLSGA
ncbi:TerD family protein [Streptomyces sp. ODS28]|uniref:TerD family protein n=1 Tax=Streptomyces sp. ODS28 TaxID=3136688 RepID=UPI0031E83979